VVGPFVGAPYAAMLLETLIAWDVEKIIFFGWCGAISHDVKIGDIIIPTHRSIIIKEMTLYPGLLLTSLKIYKKP